MNRRALHKCAAAVVAWVLLGAVASAQWVSEVYPLKAGWNAIYLHIDASHVTLNELIGADAANPIEEIWLWTPPGPTLQFYAGVQAPQAGSTEWLRWDRFWAGASPMQRLAGNHAALVRVRDDVSTYNWTVVGKAIAPRQDWSSTGLNLLGFAVPRTGAPTWGSFLGPVRSLHDYAEIYRYNGGPFSSSNPQRLFSSMLRSVRMERNHAYWVRAEEYNRYFGPFEVELQQPAGIHFGDDRGQYRLRLRNRINEPVTVSGQLVASLPAPVGQPTVDGLVPLLLRGEEDLSTLTYGFTRFSESNGTWTLAPAGEPGSDIEVVVGIDRNLMTGLPGSMYGGILRLTDTTGMLLIDLPITAEVAETSGLWMGNAVVAEVAQYLVDYSRGEEGEPLQNPDGSYVLVDINEAMGAVARPVALRLLVHNNGTDDALLLQRVYHGAAPGGTLVLARQQSALDPTALDEARRISVVHLPWSESNPGWTFDGPLGLGAQIKVTVPLDYDDQDNNPFLHTFHPDHDNLDARFENPVARGVESFDIVREITLTVMPPGGDFASVTTGTGTLSGEYEERVTVLGRATDSGANTRVFRSRGGFALNRISDITSLAD